MDSNNSDARYICGYHLERDDLGSLLRFGFIIQVAESSKLKASMQEKRRTTKKSQSSGEIHAAADKEMALIVDSLPSVLSYRT